MNSVQRVVALGFFDGVHLGHQALMRRTVEEALRRGAIPSVISFDTHPDMLVRHVPVQLLNSAAGRKELIRRVGGIDDVIMIHFDERFMRTPWAEFANTLKNELGAVHLVMGRDFSCGWRGEGTTDKLCAWCRQNDLGCDVIDEVILDGIVVSSTYIRGLVLDGQIERANQFLGHPHTLIDTVGYGYKIGRKIGTPTINTRIPEGVIVPKHGVYATRVWLPDGPKSAVTNIGVRPTFGDGNDVTVESNILDFSGNLYGSQVRLEFFEYLRPERKFTFPEELRAQIEHDIARTREYFEKGS